MRKEPEILHLTTFIRAMNNAIDSGLYPDISIEEVGKHIEDGTLFLWLHERPVAEARHLSIFEAEDERVFLDTIRRYIHAYGLTAEGKLGVKNNGLALLLAWANEIIQTGEFEPDLDWDWVVEDPEGDDPEPH